MKETGVVFNTEEVQAIQDGRKTVFRRPVNLKLPNHSEFHHFDPVGQVVFSDGHYTACSSGQIGDRIYVRETFTPFVKEHIIDDLCAYKARMGADSEEYRQAYIKAGYPYQWKPSIHMPKKYARIWLEITDIRVERVQDITREEIRKEGIILPPSPRFDRTKELSELHAEFKFLWNSRYKNWNKNPWVWVTEFKVVSQ